MQNVPLSPKWENSALKPNFLPFKVRCYWKHIKNLGNVIKNINCEHMGTRWGARKLKKFHPHAHPQLFHELHAYSIPRHGYHHPPPPSINLVALLQRTPYLSIRFSFLSKEFQKP